MCRSALAVRQSDRQEEVPLRAPLKNVEGPGKTGPLTYGTGRRGGSGGGRGRAHHQLDGWCGSCHMATQAAVRGADKGAAARWWWGAAGDSEVCAAGWSKYIVCKRQNCVTAH